MPEKKKHQKNPRKRSIPGGTSYAAPSLLVEIGVTDCSSKPVVPSERSPGQFSWGQLSAPQRFPGPSRSSGPQTREPESQSHSYWRRSAQWATFPFCLSVLSVKWGQKEGLLCGAGMTINEMPSVAAWQGSKHSQDSAGHYRTGMWNVIIIIIFQDLQYTFHFFAF